jgi:hypothetical protein
MTRFILVYGSISGVLISAIMVTAMIISTGQGTGGSQVFGYASMLFAMSLVFIAIKRYRDTRLGGVIKFWPAFGLGLATAGLASVFYVAAWEIYINTAGSGWVDLYVAQIIEAERAKGGTEEALNAFIEQTQQSMELYSNWWFRIPITFTEILPVGLVVGLVSAGLLRNPRFLPARAG